MDSKYRYFALYIGVMLILNLLIIGAPFLAVSGDKETANVIYKGLRPFCHQLPARSICLIEAPEGGLSFGDCVQQDTVPLDRYTLEDSRGTAYLLGVCARDLPLYLMMLLAGLVYPLVRKVDSTNMPPMMLFVLAIAPLTIDGLLQYLTLYESTNLIRLITGAITGTVVPFYAIPLLYYFIPIAKKAFLGKN